MALQGGDGAGHPDLAARGIVERPRVLYHKASHRFIMWLHIDDEKVRTWHTGLVQSYVIASDMTRIFNSL